MTTGTESVRQARRAWWMEWLRRVPHEITDYHGGAPVAVVGSVETRYIQRMLASSYPVRIVVERPVDGLDDAARRQVIPLSDLHISPAPVDMCGLWLSDSPPAHIRSNIDQYRKWLVPNAVIGGVGYERTIVRDTVDAMWTYVETDDHGRAWFGLLSDMMVQ